MIYSSSIHRSRAPFPFAVGRTKPPVAGVVVFRTMWMGCVDLLACPKSGNVWVECSVLAHRAPDGGSLGDGGVVERGGAGEAGESGSAVDAVALLEGAGGAVAVAVVAEC